MWCLQQTSKTDGDYQIEQNKRRKKKQQVHFASLTESCIHVYVIECHKTRGPDAIGYSSPFLFRMTCCSALMDRVIDICFFFALATFFQNNSAKQNEVTVLCPCVVVTCITTIYHCRSFRCIIVGFLLLVSEQ